MRLARILSGLPYWIPVSILRRGNSDAVGYAFVFGTMAVVLISGWCIKGGIGVVIGLFLIGAWVFVGQHTERQ